MENSYTQRCVQNLRCGEVYYWKYSKELVHFVARRIFRVSQMFSIWAAVFEWRTKIKTTTKTLIRLSTKSINNVGWWKKTYNEKTKMIVCTYTIHKQIIRNYSTLSISTNMRLVSMLIRINWIHLRIYPLCCVSGNETAVRSETKKISQSNVKRSKWPETSIEWRQVAYSGGGKSFI